MSENDSQLEDDAMQRPESFFAGLGFSPVGVERIVARMDPMFSHLTYFDYALEYIQNQFGMVGNPEPDTSSMFPFKNENTSEWFTIPGN